jgi:hypothetical protein
MIKSNRQIQLCSERIQDFKVRWREVERHGGLFPRRVVPVLLQIIKYCLDPGRDRLFDPGLGNLVLKFSHIFSEVSEDDARVLFDRKVEFESKVCPPPIDDVLSALFNESLPEKQHLLRLALMLATEDASFIVRDFQPLESVYIASENRVGLGRYFTLKDFRDLFLASRLTCPNSLLEDAPNHTKTALLKLQDMIKKQSKNGHFEFTDEVIDQIKLCFTYRWAEIRNTPLQYTRFEAQQKNASWIYAAQLLNGAGITPYFGLLMPTLSQLTNIVTDTPVETEPLFHYILSKDFKTLIHLPTSIAYYQSGLPLMNRSVYPPIYLRDSEVELIRHADQKFFQYFQLCVTRNIHKPPVSVELPVRRSTVYWVYELLIKTLKKGVKDKELETAYDSFCAQLNSLVCQVKVIDGDPVAEDIESVLNFKQILFIRKGSAFEIGYRDLAGKYSQRRTAKTEFLKHYKHGEHVNPPDCCALLVNRKPTPTEEINLLGIYNSAYVRVVNGVSGLNELWYVAARSNDWVKITDDAEQLVHYDRCIRSTLAPQAIPEEIVGTLHLPNERPLQPCCSIMMAHKPHSKQIRRILGGFKQGYIRVFNAHLKVDELYFADAEVEPARQLTKLNPRAEVLANFDCQVKSVSLPKMLSESDLENIRVITHHEADHRNLVEQQLSQLDNSSLKQLDEERQRLNRQLIEWSGTSISFKEIMDKISQGDELEGCVTAWGKYLVKFVVDHFPEIDFSIGISDLVNLPLMRESIKQKPCIDDLTLNQEEINRRNHLLLISLFSISTPELDRHSIYQLNLLDCSHQISNVRLIRSTFIRLMSNLSTSKNVEDVYTFLMNNFVRPLELVGRLGELPLDVKKWIDEVKGPDFVTNTSIYYEPDTLFSALCSIYKSPDANPEITALMDDILRTMLQRKPPAFIKVVTNIKLKRFLQNVDPVYSDTIRSIPTNMSKPDNEQFNKACYSYLMQRASASEKVTWFALMDTAAQRSRQDFTALRPQRTWKEISEINQLLLLVYQDYIATSRGRNIQGGLAYLKKMGLVDNFLMELPDENSVNSRSIRPIR